MTISREILATFATRGAWAGLPLLAQEKIEKSQRALRDIDPMDSVGVAQLQRDIKNWSDIGSIQDQVIKFAGSSGQANSTVAENNR